MKKSKPLPPIRQKDPIEEKIEQRRRQILVHSYIYYALDDNIISDSQWSKWAVELAELQEKYPEIAEQTAFAEDFKDFDPSTGFNLNYRQPEIMRKVEQLLELEKKKR